MKAIKFNSNVFRLVSGSVVLIAIVLATFVVRWTIANTSAQAADQKEVAVLLAELSPSDPQTHRASAILHEKAFEPGDLEIALLEYEKAAAACPYNYLFWLSLGSARTRAGEIEKAEAALRRAHALAPNYSRVQWALGNLLLREGRDDEGYSAVRKAIENDPSLTPSAVTLAMQLSPGDDVGSIEQRLGASSHIYINLALLLVQQERFEEARAIWRKASISSDKVVSTDTVNALKQSAISAKQFRLAAEIGSALSGEDKATVGTVSNAGFESPVRAQNAGDFDWRVPQQQFPQYAVTDAKKASGKFSLVAAVSSNDAKELNGISQTIAVEPGKSYSLRFSYLSNVNSNAEYFWEVLAAADMKQLSRSPKLLPTDNWQTATIDLLVPPEYDGIVIRLARAACTGSACTSSGNLWFDDFDLIQK